MNILFLLVVLVSTCILPIVQGNLQIGWIENTFSAGIYCPGQLEGLSAPCHLIGHWVMYVYESENVPLHRHQLQGATKMSLDGGVTFFPYGDIHFEVHGFNMTNNDTNNARAIVYNVQFEQTYLDFMQTPSNICAKVTVLSPEFPLQTSDVACIDINKNDMWFVGNTIERSWYKLGNATAECYKNLEVCHVMAHVAIDTATVGGGPLARVAGNGEYSLDGGQTWIGEGGRGLELLRMEKHTDGQLYQRLHWGFEMEMSMTAVETTVGDICWRIWVTNTITGSQPTWVDMGDEDGGTMGYQLSRYIRCFVTERYFYDD